MKHEDFETLSLTEIIQLQNKLSEIVVRRFETSLALFFSDIVSSTEYFARFGDEAGYKLQRRHFDLLEQVVPNNSGRIVDRAGDGAFSCFPMAEQAAEASVQLQLALCKDNINRGRDQQLVVRIGIHYGKVLTDNVLVTGEAVSLCARVAAASKPDEIRLTGDAYAQLPSARRACCRAMPAIELKGIPRPVATLVLEWRDANLFPTAFRIEETSSVFPLPSQDIISFGRLRENNGVPANDVVLTHPDPGQSNRISRWQFELRRGAEGFFLRQIAETSKTEEDSVEVPLGKQVQIKPGTKVRIGRSLTLTFLAGSQSEGTRTDATFASEGPIQIGG